MGKFASAAVAGALLLCLAASGCTSTADDGSPPSTTSTSVVALSIEGDQPLESLMPVVRSLGCDTTRSVRVNGWGLDQSLECFMNGTYLGRVHGFDPSVTDGMVTSDAGLFSLRYPDTESLAGDGPCKEFSPGVVVGDGWAVVVPTESAAPEAAERTGGVIVPPNEPGPIVSYLPPPICQET